MSNPINPDEVRGSPAPLVRCSPMDECSMLPIAAVEGDMHILRHVNPAFCTLAGKNKEDLLGKPFADAVPGGDRWLSSAERIYLTGEPGPQTEGEDKIHHPLYWLFSQRPVAEGAEPPRGVLIQLKGAPEILRQATAMTQALMLTAVRYHALKADADRLNAQLGEENTERQLAEERLVTSLQSLRRLAGAINEHEILTISDLRGRIIYANDRFCAISKFTRKELLGQDHRLVSSGTHSREFLREMWATIAEGRVWHGEVRDRAKDGTLFWLETTIVPCLDPKGDPFQYVAIRTDITTRKESEAALMESQRVAEQANRAKDEFIAALSHELRTPLTPVLLTATSLAADEQLDPGLRSQMELIRQNIAMEAQLIDDLLDVTKIARGKVSLRSEDVDLHHILARALDTVKEDIFLKKIAVEVQTDAEHFHVNADPMRIQQVFWNLIKNAVKFTPEGGRIHIRSSNDMEGTLCVEICDTGIGIAPENLPSIFVPFEQGAVAGVHRFGGLGLGLTIAKSIVELHGGTLVAASGGAGQGATFTVRLPVPKPESIAPAREHAPPFPEPIKSAGHLHVLLVEDHEATRTVLTRLLSREGHNVEAVGTCEAAREACDGCNKEAECRFEAVISDLGLPDGSGIDLIRDIKARFPAINAIAVSGFGSEEDLRRCAEAGFSHHLVKPISLDALRNALAA